MSLVQFSPAQIEREREEHLRPRLQLIEAERASSEVSDRALNAKEESSSSEEEETVPVKPKLPPAAPPPKPPVESAPSQQSLSETNTPFTDDEASRLSAPGQFDEESSSQPAFGPAMKEDSLKMGFGSLKLGGCMHDLLASSCVSFAEGLCSLGWFFCLFVFCLRKSENVTW